jgi:hypothetical protein
MVQLPHGYNEPVDCRLLRKATPDEVLDRFTVEDKNGSMVFYKTDSDTITIMGYNNDLNAPICDKDVLLTSFNWLPKPPIPYAWWSKLWNEPQYPRRK